MSKSSASLSAKRTQDPIRRQLLEEAIELYPTDPLVASRYALTGVQGIRKTSTARLMALMQSVIASSFYVVPTLARDHFTFVNEGARSSQLVLSLITSTGMGITGSRRRSPRFPYEILNRLQSLTAPKGLDLPEAKARDWVPRAVLRWELITVRPRQVTQPDGTNMVQMLRVVNDAQTVPVRSVADVNQAIREAIRVANALIYIEDIDFYLEPAVRVAEVSALPLLSRNRSRNCVLNGIIDSTPEATREEITAKLRKEWPDLFQPSAVGERTIESLARLSGYELRFYSPLGRYVDVEPWACFNSGSKHRRVLKMYVDGFHASLEVRGVCTSIEYMSQKDILEAKDLYDVHEQKYDWGVFPPMLKGLVVTGNEGKLVMLKANSARPSLYTTEIMDDDVAYAHLMTPTSIFAELFRRKFGVMKPTASCYEICRQSEKFPRNTLMRAHPMNETIVTIDHNRSFMAYETHPEYVGFPLASFVTLEGDVEAIGDLKRAFVRVKSFKWTDMVAKKIYHATINDTHPECMTNVMYNYLKTVAEIEVEHSVMATFAKESVLDFVKNLKVPESERKLISCSIVGSLIAGGVSETRKHKFVCDDESLDRIRYELGQLAADPESTGVLGYSCSPANPDAGTPATVSFTKINLQTANACHIHSFILDYSTTATMKAFRTVYERIPDQVISICADAIRVTNGAFNQVRDSFNMGTRPGQWKHSIGLLPKVYGTFTPFIDHKPIEWTDNEPRDDSHVFTTLPYNYSRVFISGPGGVGKTHHILQNYSDDVLMLFPTKELRDKVRESTSIEAHTLAWYLKRCSVGAQPPHAIIVVDEVFMFSYQQIAALMHYSANRIIYLMGDPAQVHNSFGTPFTEEHLSTAWHRVDFKRGPISRHGEEFGQFLDSLRSLSDQEILKVLSDTLEPFDGSYELTDIAIISTHREASQVTDAYLEYYDDIIDPEMLALYGKHVKVRYAGIAIKLVASTKGLNVTGKLPKYARASWSYQYKDMVVREDGIADEWGTLDSLTWYGRRSMTDTIPDGYCYEPCFARTVHSQQGRTISEGRLLISPSLVNIPGALYTAVSRVRSMDQLVLGVK